MFEKIEWWCALCEVVLALLRKYFRQSTSETLLTSVLYAYFKQGLHLFLVISFHASGESRWYYATHYERLGGWVPTAAWDRIIYAVALGSWVDLSAFAVSRVRTFWDKIFTRLPKIIEMRDDGRKSIWRTFDSLAVLCAVTCLVGIAVTTSTPTNGTTLGNSKELELPSKLNILLVGHELSLSGAPTVLLHTAIRLRGNGFSVTMHFRQGGPLRAAVQVI
jgi:hypothetical protein